MATALADLEKVASWSQRPPFPWKNNFQRSCSFEIWAVRGSWNFRGTAQKFSLGITRPEWRARRRRGMTIRAEKNAGRSEGPKGSVGRDLKFDSTDMMELEFGRLLGEDRQTTLAKVIGKKVNPNSTYVNIEKEKELQEQKDLARRSSPAHRVPAPARPQFKLQQAAIDYTTVKQAREPGVPDLASPPVRPPGSEKADRLPGRALRVVPPVVRSGGGKKSVDSDSYELEGLVRKPMRVSEAEKGLPPARPEKAVIAPMLMRRNEAAPVDTLPRPGDSLLRRPATSRVNAFGEPLASDSIPSSVAVEESESEGNVDSDDLSEEKFRQLLDGKGGGPRGETVDSNTSVPRRASPPVRPILPNLEKKPSILEKPQLVNTTEISKDEFADVASSAGSKDGTALQGVEPQKPPPKVEPILSELPDMKEQTRPKVPLVTLGIENNNLDEVKTDNVNDLEESSAKLQIAESEPDNRLGKTSEDVGEVRISMDVGESRKVENRPEIVARKPILRLQKTSLPSEQPGVPQDNGGSFSSTSQDSSSETDISTVTPDSAVQKQEEELKVAEQSIKVEQQVGTGNTVPKTRQPAPGLRLSRPGSRAAYTSKKEAEAALNNLQKAVSSFDERRIITNKKENDEDWARAEALRESNAIEELEIVGTGRGGLLLGFGSLVGYLPAFELKAERRPPSFNSWVKTNDAKTNNTQDEENKTDSELTRTSVESTASSTAAQETDVLMDTLEKRNSEPKDPELLERFKKERAVALSSFAGQKAKVVVTSVDKALGQLRFSEKQAEGEGQELNQRKIALMESLNVGDIVTCQVTKITTFGAFVDLQGVPALIHSSELSWNRNVDPLTVVQVGQEVQVKVCKLDRFLQRINLSLKLMQPDPLLETLESLVSSEDADLVGTAAVVESQVEENEELNTFVRKLESIPEIAAVSTGRRVRGAALAPAFQIYLSGPLDRGYKLLARFGNEVQEVLVETSADRERMKDFIRDCTVQDS